MLHLLSLQMDQTGGGGGAAGGVSMLVTLVIVVLVFASIWKVFDKANEPGWAAIIPIYNAVVLLKIVGRPIWWIVLLLIPFVSIIVSLVVVNDVSKSFGKGIGFTLGMIFLPFVFWPILGFGDARYEGPSA